MIGDISIGTKIVKTTRLFKRHLVAKVQDREQTQRGIAVHEAAHFIATLNYGMAIGAKGVYITDEGGFTDAIPFPGRTFTTISKDERQAYFVLCMVGPIAEYKFLKHPPTDRDVRSWMNDFLNCTRTGVRDENGVCHLNSEELVRAARLVTDFFSVLENPNFKTLEIINPVLGDIGHECRKAMTVADYLVRDYTSEISQFADVLIAARRVSPEDCIRWRDANFHLHGC